MLHHYLLFPYICHHYSCTIQGVHRDSTNLAQLLHNALLVASRVRIPTSGNVAWASGGRSHLPLPTPGKKTCHFHLKLAGICTLAFQLGACAPGLGWDPGKVPRVQMHPARSAKIQHYGAHQTSSQNLACSRPNLYLPRAIPSP